MTYLHKPAVVFFAGAAKKKLAISQHFFEAAATGSFESSEEVKEPSPPKKSRLNRKKTREKKGKKTKNDDIELLLDVGTEEKKLADIRLSAYLSAWKTVEKVVDEQKIGLLKPVVDKLVNLAVGADKGQGRLSCAALQLGYGSGSEAVGSVGSSLFDTLASALEKAGCPLVRLRSELHANLAKCLPFVAASFYSVRPPICSVGIISNKLVNKGQTSRHPLTTWRRFCHWLENSCTNTNRLVLFVEDVDAFPPNFLDSLVRVLAGRRESYKNGMLLVMGVAGASTIRSRLSADAYRPLEICAITFSPPQQLLEKAFEQLLLTKQLPTVLSGRLIRSLRNAFQLENQSVAEFAKHVRLVLVRHFLDEPLSIFCCHNEEAEARLSELSGRQLAAFCAELDLSPNSDTVDDASSRLMEMLDDFDAYRSCFLTLFRVLNVLLEEFSEKPSFLKLFEWLMSNDEDDDGRVVPLFPPPTSSLAARERPEIACTWESLWLSWSKETVEQKLEIIANIVRDSYVGDLAEFYDQLRELRSSFGTVEQRQTDLDQHRRVLRDKDVDERKPAEKKGNRLAFAHMQALAKQRVEENKKFNLLAKERQQFVASVRKTLGRFLRPPEHLKLGTAFTLCCLPADQRLIRANNGFAVDVALLEPQKYYASVGKSGGQVEPAVSSFASAPLCDASAAYRSLVELVNALEAAPDQTLTAEMGQWLEKARNDFGTCSFSISDETRLYKAAAELELLGLVRLVSEKLGKPKTVQLLYVAHERQVAFEN